MAGIFNPFAGTAEAELSERGIYLTAGGTYLLEVKKTIFKTTRKSGDAFIVEFRVVESDMPQHRPGSRATWFQSLRDRSVALPSIKAFMLALFQIESGDLETPEVQGFLATLDETLMEACETETMFEGHRVRVSTEAVVTKKGLDFTRHNWGSWEGQQPDL